jgi:hypothetical protein
MTHAGDRIAQTAASGDRVPASSPVREPSAPLLALIRSLACRAHRPATSTRRVRSPRRSAAHLGGGGRAMLLRRDGRRRRVVRCLAGVRVSDTGAYFAGRFPRYWYGRRARRRRSKARYGALAARCSLTSYLRSPPSPRVRPRSWRRLTMRSRVALKRSSAAIRARAMGDPTGGRAAGDLDLTYPTCSGLALGSAK